MIASELISNVVPVLKPEDTCLQALNWMELFRVSHLPMEPVSYTHLTLPTT